MSLSTTSIVTNMLAANSARQLGITNDRKAKSSEKLSSGYRINRAGDDAAGLAISEKMRRQIRGLRQGMDNIGEGISLVQTADGALDEIANILQRMNELSIQAYNDTNAREDREYIQQEIDNLISEIDRTVQDTTFNEKAILQGNPTEYKKITSDMLAGNTTLTSKVTLTRSIPSWVSIPNTFSTNNSAGLTLTQDVENEVFIKPKNIQTDSSGNVTKAVFEYWGPEDGSYQNGSLYNQIKNYAPEMEFQYKGSLTDSLSDNASMYMDFGGLAANTNSVSDLYENLTNLLGCTIGVPCATCNSHFYGVTFTGSATDPASGAQISCDNQVSQYTNMTSNSYSNHAVCLNLSGNGLDVFDRVESIMNDASLSESEKNAKAKELAGQISKDLASAVNQAIGSSTGDHYNAVGMENDTKVIVYDYRDQSVISNVRNDFPVQTSAAVEMSIPVAWLEEDTYAYVEEPLMIQCSSQADDVVPIDFADVSVDRLGLRGYDVSKYGWVQGSGIGHEETTAVVVPAQTATRNVGTQQLVQPAGPDQNGEWQHAKYKMVMTQEEYVIPEHTETKTTWIEDVPGTIQYQYMPDNVDCIKEALHIVSEERARLGASQNRLEHTYNNNANKHENSTAAESAIRDTNMAKEMVQNAKDNILQQVGQSMLSQANQDRQGMLQLLG